MSGQGEADSAGCAGNVLGCFLFVEWILGIVLHLWTVGIAWDLSGGVAAFFAFFFPFLAEVVVGWAAFQAHGFASVYILLLLTWCLVCGAKWLGAFFLTANE